MQISGARPGGGIGTVATSLYPGEKKPAIKPVYLWFIPGLNYQEERSYQNSEGVTRYNATCYY
ncbi:MAG: hypothetical protein HOK42_05490 [Candidatus Marinimicrobia bacterium]|jgi:hypothetical protein|nr:hypothetical protein [Candidatus Neomarinimicrobiota bacterium]